MSDTDILIETETVNTDEASTAPRRFVVPVVHMGVIFSSEIGGTLSIAVDGEPVPESRHATQTVLERVPALDFTVEIDDDGAPIAGSPLRIQVGGWSGAVDWMHGGLVHGYARNLRDAAQDVVVVAFTSTGVVSAATARADDGGSFLLVLPPERVSAFDGVVRLGIAGSDYILENGILPRARVDTPALHLVPRPDAKRHVRIKISTPNLKEAPAWGDYHFARSLAAAFERDGQFLGVDTMDAWNDHRDEEDVVIALRGRQPFKTDRAKINIMWLISHPDRVPDAEYETYDHIAVASDIYAAELKRRGIENVSVLHQAADRDLFGQPLDLERKPACLFVGNSRREYRTMVKWCVRNDMPIELYGGGWSGVLPDEMVRALNVLNADLPRYYGSHAILLNDHWDSMRLNGFISNRIFDGSAAGAPIITDAVLGLAEVFGDTINVVEDEGGFVAMVQDCLANPDAYLEKAARAREIVLSGHTFDHRRDEIGALIEAVAKR